MPKCPKCKEEIDSLNNVQSGHSTYSFCLVGSEGYYELDGFEADNSVNDWRCPKCDEVIAQTEEEAIKFLEQKADSKAEDYAIGEMIEGQIDEAVEAKADLQRKGEGKDE